MMKKQWPQELTNLLNQMMENIKSCIISDAEEFADFNGMNIVNGQSLEIALYKATATLNETNHAAILKKLGPDEGMKLINSIESRAKHDVSEMLFNELEKMSDELSPEIQDIVRKLSAIKKKIDSGQTLTKEDLENLQKENDGEGLF